MRLHLHLGRKTSAKHQGVVAAMRGRRHWRPAERRYLGFRRHLGWSRRSVEFFGVPGAVWSCVASVWSERPTRVVSSTPKNKRSKRKSGRVSPTTGGAGVLRDRRNLALGPRPKLFLPFNVLDERHQGGKHGSQRSGQVWKVRFPLRKGHMVWWCSWSSAGEHEKFLEETGGNRTESDPLWANRLSSLRSSDPRLGRSAEMSTSGGPWMLKRVERDGTAAVTRPVDSACF